MMENKQSKERSVFRFIFQDTLNNNKPISVGIIIYCLILVLIGDFIPKPILMSGITLLTIFFICWFVRYYKKVSCSEYSQCLPINRALVSRINGVATTTICLPFYLISILTIMRTVETIKFFTISCYLGIFTTICVVVFIGLLKRSSKISAESGTAGYDRLLFSSVLIAFIPLFFVSLSYVMLLIFNYQSILAGDGFTKLRNSLCIVQSLITLIVYAPTLGKNHTQNKLLFSLYLFKQLRRYALLFLPIIIGFIACSAYMSAHFYYQNAEQFTQQVLVPKNPYPSANADKLLVLTLVKRCDGAVMYQATKILDKTLLDNFNIELKNLPNAPDLFKYFTVEKHGKIETVLDWWLEHDHSKNWPAKPKHIKASDVFRLRNFKPLESRTTYDSIPYATQRDKNGILYISMRYPAYNFTIKDPLYHRLFTKTPMSIYREQQTSIYFIPFNESDKMIPLTSPIIAKRFNLRIYGGASYYNGHFYQTNNQGEFKNNNLVVHAKLFILIIILIILSCIVVKFNIVMMVIAGIMVISFVVGGDYYMLQMRMQAIKDPDLNRGMKQFAIVDLKNTFYWQELAEKYADELCEDKELDQRRFINEVFGN